MKGQGETDDMREQEKKKIDTIYFNQMSWGESLDSVFGSLYCTSNMSEHLMSPN